MSKKINTKDLDEIFDNLVSEDKLNIDSIEELMLTELEDYKKELRLHIEELLSNKLNEKKLITKKNKNGKKKDTN
jgi:hypothetical protein